MRRERESQLDPEKRAKKDEHRKRGKKRGLKEEKLRRRSKALSESRKTKDGGICVGGGVDEDEDEDEEHGGWISTLSAGDDGGGAKAEELALALEIKYMSSEEEVDTSDPVVLSQPVIDVVATMGPAPSLATSLATSLDPPAPATLNAGEKTFSVHRPAWRSQRLQTAFARLDALNPPERAYRRIVGPERQGELPPEGTPAWMVDQEWEEREGTALRKERDERIEKERRDSGRDKDRGERRSRRPRRSTTTTVKGREASSETAVVRDTPVGEDEQGGPNLGILSAIGGLGMGAGL